MLSDSRAFNLLIGKHNWNGAESRLSCHKRKIIKSLICDLVNFGVCWVMVNCLTGVLGSPYAILNFPTNRISLGLLICLKIVVCGPQLFFGSCLLNRWHYLPLIPEAMEDKKTSWVSCSEFGLNERIWEKCTKKQKNKKKYKKQKKI